MKIRRNCYDPIGIVSIHDNIYDKEKIVSYDLSKKERKDRRKDQDSIKKTGERRGSKKGHNRIRE